MDGKIPNRGEGSTFSSFVCRVCLYFSVIFLLEILSLLGTTQKWKNRLHFLFSFLIREKSYDIIDQTHFTENRINPANTENKNVITRECWNTMRI